MARFNRRFIQERKNVYSERGKQHANQYMFSDRGSSHAKRGVYKPYRNARAGSSQRRFLSRGANDNRRFGGRRGGKMYVRSDSQKGDELNERYEIRRDLAGPKSKDASEISVILGVDINKAKHFFAEALKSDSRLKRCLTSLDKAFKAESTTAMVLNIINAMNETSFVLETVGALRTYLESKHSEEEDADYLDAVCSLLNIMIRVCELNPSALTFIYGSFAVISELVHEIKHSKDKTKDTQSAHSFHEINVTNESTHFIHESDTAQDCSITEVREVEINHGNQITKRCTQSEESNFANVEILFAEFDEKVKLCTSRKRKHKEQESENVDESSSEHFRDIPIFPRLEDLNGDIKPNLRVNKAKGSYTSVDDYLDVQFRLLREDFIEPLREGIHAYTGQLFEKNKKKIQEIKVYDNVHILSAVCGDGLNHILSFDLSKLKHIRWNMTKRLKYGSLVCLSADDFRTCYFAAIVDSENKYRRQGRLHVKFAYGSPNIQSLIGSTFTMIESTAYFEAYRPVLSSLKDITEKNLPFQRYIIQCKSEVNPPAYLLHDVPTVFDLSSLLDPNFKVHSNTRIFEIPDRKLFASTQINKSGTKNVDILGSDWLMGNEFHLDKSQLDALKTALTKEFAIIQGPPGCGKTHLGLQIAKVLLHNRHVWNPIIGKRAQMLVVCYTNHALDQFMEGICAFFDGDIVRVGSRSSNASMADYNIKSIKSRLRKSKAFPKYIYRSRLSASGNTKALKRELNLESEKIRVLRQNIVDEQSLLTEMGTYFYKQFQWFALKVQKGKPPLLKYLGNSKIVEWLGIHDMAIRIQDLIQYSPKRVEENDIVKIIDNEIYVENREKITDTDFDIYSELDDFQKQELEAYKIANISLDLDEINNLEGQFLHTAKRSKIELERRQLTNKIQHYLQNIKPLTRTEALSASDIFNKNFSTEKRWALYLHWVQLKCKKMYKSKAEKFAHYEQADARLKEVAMMEERFIFQNADIIGLTITGAAKHKAVLREVKPTIMIVEEAAEVLESHLISNLTPGCQHLIMIGDHKQLKPKPNVYRLEREYNLDISLFERMIRNGIKCNSLQIQHRMRPEIADLVRPIYKNLIDHENVEKYKPVCGITSNLFFIDHTVKEKKNEELKSYTNVHEARYLIALCKYLLLQGYKKSEITILTTYTGQMYIMKQEMLKENDVLNGVCMTIVDNYQGEENDIILLSLVRSNIDGTIGYLGRDNRICVALSRAKIGFYIIGNSEALLSKSDLWRSVIEIMRQKGIIGKALRLCCQNHQNDAGIMAACSDDFQLAPEGGCGKPCDIRLDCGHTCGKYCHILNREHRGIICRKPCARKCRNGHECKMWCFQDCLCNETIIITLPDCGHVMEVKCSTILKKFQDFECDQPCKNTLQCGHMCKQKCYQPCVCVQPVKVVLPCGHSTTIPCSVPPEKHKCNEYVHILKTDCGHLDKRMCRDASKSCTKICGLQLDCGHECKEECGDSSNKSNQISDFISSFSKCPRGHTSYCKKKCEAVLKCGHSCAGSCCTCFKGRWHKLCQEKCNCSLICGHHCKGKCGFCLPCTEKCSRSCRHDICTKRCSEVCASCTKQCSWKCKHFVCSQQCGKICDRPRCFKPCGNLLPCKHICIGMCGDPCPTLCRICNNKKVSRIRFGGENLQNSRFVQLQDCGHLIRYDIMDEYMDIDEGACLKRCPICNEPIRTTNGNRYEGVVNKMFLTINLSKQLTLQDVELRRM